MQIVSARESFRQVRQSDREGGCYTGVGPFLWWLPVMQHSPSLHRIQPPIAMKLSAEQYKLCALLVRAARQCAAHFAAGACLCTACTASNICTACAACNFCTACALLALIVIFTMFAIFAILALLVHCLHCLQYLHCLCTQLATACNTGEMHKIHFASTEHKIRTLQSL